MNYDLIVLIDKNVKSGKKLMNVVNEKIKKFDAMNYGSDFNNPNRKYYSYTPSNGIPTILDNYVSTCRIKEIKMLSDKNIFQEALKVWDFFVQNKAMECTDNNWESLRRLYFLERYKTRINFADFQSTFHTFALLTKDCHWLQESQFEDSKQWLEVFKNTLLACDENDWAIVLSCVL